ncbi:hypothetical protein CK203_110121 [Vitis vinifera]|uniref:Uncharacterized protein n=1 Tax=Vitis vinifera TaxID=29760 RepID=A0A438CRB8_VITVI|nr:hypothetical protein CK203_110121 [Vitis vinifera]
MVLRSLQPRIARHVVGVPFTDFGSLVMALYDVEDGITRGLWADSSLSDVKGKKPFIGPRSTEVGAISSSSQRPFRRHQPIPQFSEPHSSYASHQYRPQTPHPAYDQTHMPQTLVLPSYATQGIERPPVSYTTTGQPCYAAQFTLRPAPSYPRPRAQQTSAPFALTTQRQFSQIGMPLSQALRKLTEAGLLTALTPRPLSADSSSVQDGFTLCLSSGPGHETDRCTALRHAILGSDRLGFGTLGPAECYHKPVADPHHTCNPEPIMPTGIYETSGVILEPQMLVPFRLVLRQHLYRHPLPSL